MPSAHLPSQFQPLKPTEFLVVAAGSVATAVVASMDQCTRGPSITAWVLTNGPTLLNNAPWLFC